MRDIQILLIPTCIKIGSYNRRMILDNYSVKRMTNDCIYAYNLLLEQPNKELLSADIMGAATAVTMRY